MPHRRREYANLSARDCNVLDALDGAGGSRQARDEAHAIYLRWNARDWRAAEKCALEWLRMRDSLKGWTAQACKGQAAQRKGTASEVIAFIRTRFERQYFPDGRAA